MKGRNDFDPKSNVAKSLDGRLFYDARCFSECDNFQFHLELPAR